MNNVIWKEVYEATKCSRENTQSQNENTKKELLSDENKEFIKNR